MLVGDTPKKLTKQLEYFGHLMERIVVVLVRKHRHILIRWKNCGKTKTTGLHYIKSTRVHGEVECNSSEKNNKHIGTYSFKRKQN